MTITVLAFGITRDICGQRRFTLDLPEKTSSDALLAILQEKYPPLRQLSSLLVAVNESYADPGHVLADGDEVALIPPVSGG